MKIFTTMKNIILGIIKAFMRCFHLTNILLMINTAVLIFVLFSFSLFDYILVDFQRQMDIYRYIWQQQIREINHNITKAIKFVTENDKEQMEIDKQQQTQIEDLTENININIDKLVVQQEKMLEKLEKTRKIDLDNVENIKQANFGIYNTTAGIQGSGSHIKILEHHYILTCAHLIKDEKDFIWAVGDDGNMRPLGLVKINVKKDLALFKIYMVEDMSYLEISEEIPKEGSEIVVIGNPDNINDTITDGIIAKITKDRYLFTNLVYFGNSGGAVLYKGKIVGLVSNMEVFFNPKKLPLFVNYGSGPNLKTIREFLKLNKEE